MKREAHAVYAWKLHVGRYRRLVASMIESERVQIENWPYCFRRLIRARANEREWSDFT